MILRVLSWIGLQTLNAHTRECQERTISRLSWELAHEKQRNAELSSDRDYWKKRAELIIDRALVRSGAATEAVMMPAPSPGEVEASSPFRGLGMAEFDSTKQ